MLIWGGSFFMVKISLDHIPPLFFAFLRSLLVAVILVPFVRVPRGKFKEIALISVTFGSLHFPLMFIGLDGTDVAAAAIAVQLQVPFAVLLGVFFFRESLSWRQVAGIAVALAGMVMIFGAPNLAGGAIPLLMVIGASFAWAVASTQIKAAGPIDPFVLSGWVSLFSAPQILVATVLLEDGQWVALLNADEVVFGSICYMAVVVSVFSYYVWYQQLQRHPVGQVVPFTLLVPVFGVASGVLFRDEPFTLGFASGSLLTLAGVAFIVLREFQLPTVSARKRLLAWRNSEPAREQRDAQIGNTQTST